MRPDSTPPWERRRCRIRRKALHWISPRRLAAGAHIPVPRIIPTSSPPPWARALGIAGLLPFGAGALALWAWRDPTTSAHIGFALAAYAATIAAFLGGIHWGTALRAGGPAPVPLIWGVLPQLAGWLALLLPIRAGLLTCAAVLVACYLADRRLYPQEGLAAWLPMRLQLTVGAAASCVLGAAA